MGGLGIFTKAAVKLYPWDGPEKIMVHGRTPNLIADVPKNHVVETIGVENWSKMVDLEGEW